ncbi:MAG: methyltransferase domain-containing protein [Bacteroidota bacterium]
MRYQSYFNTAVSLLNAYDGSVPLVHFLKNHFAQHKKHGSKDRKLISHLCYGYYRLGHAVKDLSVEERLRVSIFLCNDQAGAWNILFEQAWLDKWNDNLQQRIDFIALLYASFSLKDVFPWKELLSEGMDLAAFMQSHFIQPDLFLRIRPGYEKKVPQKLTEHQLSYQAITTTCLALPNTTKLDTILAIDKEAVVQDYSSQRIAEFFPALTTDDSRLTPHASPLTIWDCCAASGGKSLLAYDTLKNITLTVSDIRPSILRNLKERFERAGIKQYESFVADLASFKIQHSTFNIILCDAPCSGSGTWGRTPEQLYFFTEDKIAEYAELQTKILRNMISQVDANGYLLYITCSVFEKENEAQVNLLLQTGEFELVKMELLKGYELKADSMFAALLRKG